MKKIERRSFIKGIGAALAMVVIPVLPKIPKIPVSEPEIPETLPENGTVSCRDYMAQVTIQDYKVGDTIRYQDLAGGARCETCLHEPRCIASGKKFEGYNKGKFCPEKWNKKASNKAYREVIFRK